MPKFHKDAFKVELNTQQVLNAVAALAREQIAEKYATWSPFVRVIPGRGALVVFSPPPEPAPQPPDTGAENAGVSTTASDGRMGAAVVSGGDRPLGSGAVASTPAAPNSESP